MYDFRGSDILLWERPVLVSPEPTPEAPAPETPDICATCGSETMRGFGKGESASYGVFVACRAARCDRYVKQAAPRRISWAAVAGGVVLVVVLQLLLSLLGAGVGLGTVNTNAGSTPMASTLGIGAGLWWVFSNCLAIGVGGFVAAWFAGVEIPFDGVLQTFWLLTSAIGSVIGGGF
jgi:hypothetical protein